MKVVFSVKSPSRACRYFIIRFAQEGLLLSSAYFYIEHSA